MKIVKSFDDHIFFEKTYYLSDIQGQWFCGLSDDGELYCKCPADFKNPEEWYLFEELRFNINLDDMKRIVKEFGNLLVFL